MQKGKLIKLQIKSEYDGNKGYKKALLSELSEVYESKGCSIHILFAQDLQEFDRNDLELRLRAGG
jgi:hypothetical protein